jgi:chromosome partitioning protein
MTHIYTFANQKGGVGKTTSTINLGAFLASSGQRVLLIDIDPQANATSSLGIDKNNITTGTYAVLLGSVPIAAEILHHPKWKISILPSSSALAGAEIELMEFPNRAYRLRDTLSSVKNRYDYILIDCPPAINLLTINGLVAADNGILVPVQCEYLALEGLGQLTQTINKVRNSLFPELEIRGVFLTMFDIRTKLSVDVVNEVRKYFPGKVFDTIIPRTIRLAEAPSYGMPISAYAPDSSASRAYASLSNEILIQDGIKTEVMVND